MSYALGEVEALAKKATRGAGYSWGMAEEASKAVRSLCSLGLDGCAALVDVLQRFDGVAASNRAPMINGLKWSADHGPLCPLYLGTTLSDHAHLLGDEPIICHAVVQPLLLIPFASQVTRITGGTLTIRMPGAQFITNPQQTSIDGKVPDVATELAIEFGGIITQPCNAHSRAFPNPPDWDLLNAFAHRTYAPATEESRRKGAG